MPSATLVQNARLVMFISRYSGDYSSPAPWTGGCQSNTEDSRREPGASAPRRPAVDASILEKEFWPKVPKTADNSSPSHKDVSAARWLEWFNGAVQESFQQYGFFDPEGVFIGDGSYLFVPDNPAYEDSVVMWFDEHTREVLELEPSARDRALRKIRRLEQSFLCPVANLRPRSRSP